MSESTTTVRCGYCGREWRSGENAPTCPACGDAHAGRGLSVVVEVTWLELLQNDPVQVRSLFAVRALNAFEAALKEREANLS